MIGHGHGNDHRLLILAVSGLSQIFETVKRLEKKMGAVADALAGVKDQLAKAQAEITGKISDLETQLNSKGVLDADDQAAIDALKTQAQALDDIVPDVPPAPVDNPPAT